jgi:glutamate racemase
LGIALGGGLAFGYTLAFIGNSMDHTLRSPEEAVKGFQDLNIPVVGVVSKIMTSAEKLNKNIRTGVLTLLIVLATIVSLGLSTYSAVNRIQQGNNTQVREEVQQRIVHNNESDLTNRPIRIQ